MALLPVLPSMPNSTQVFNDTSLVPFPSLGHLLFCRFPLEPMHVKAILAGLMAPIVCSNGEKKTRKMYTNSNQSDVQGQGRGLKAKVVNRNLIVENTVYNVDNIPLNLNPP